MVYSEGMGGCSFDQDQDGTYIRVKPCPERPEYLTILQGDPDGKYDPDEVEIHKDNLARLILALQMYAESDW